MAADWELSKENIQPLRSGRKASALAPRDQKDVHDEKRTFEANLRTYQGPDLLAPWFEYVAWTEQNFPKGSKDLVALLEKCIRNFRDDEAVKQDERYLEIWTKYASTWEKPLDCYDFMSSKGICTTLPEFHLRWAWELEQVGSFKKADLAFKRGLEMVRSGGGGGHGQEGQQQQQLLEVMETKHRQFQARVAKHLMEVHGGSSSSAEGEAGEALKEEERAALASLKGHGKHSKVGSIRVGAAKSSEHPGVLHGAQPPTKKPLAAVKNRPTAPFSIFNDDEQNSPAAEEDHLLPASSLKGNDDGGGPFSFGKDRNSENEVRPGKWTKNRLGAKKTCSVPIDQISRAPTFSVHQDSVQPPRAEAENGPLPSSSGEGSGGSFPGLKPALTTLKVSSGTDHFDDKDSVVALFEPPDPLVKPMYCKHLVYQGVTEFSFEELRAVRYWKQAAEQETVAKYREMLQITKEVEQRKREADSLKEVLRNMQEQQQNMLREQQAWHQQNMVREQQAWQQQNALQQGSRSSAASRFAVYQDSEGTKDSSVSPRGARSSDVTTCGADQAGRSSSVAEDTKLLLQAASTSSLTTNAANTNTSMSPPSGKGVVGSLKLCHSPTANTVELSQLVKGMWNGQVEDVALFKRPTSSSLASASSSSALQAAKKPLREEPEVAGVACGSSNVTCPFPIFRDDVEGSNEGAQAKGSDDGALRGSEPPSFVAAFPIFCDENAVRPRKSNAAVRSDDFKENQAPQGYPVDNAERNRPKAGVLVESENVRFVNLEVQERVLDEDEEAQRQQSSSNGADPDGAPRPVPSFGFLDQTNATMKVPSMEAFAEMAHAASTPFHGRRFVPEEDENTCAVKIVFKEPLPPPMPPSKSEGVRKDEPDEGHRNEDPEDSSGNPHQIQSGPQFAPQQPQQQQVDDDQPMFRPAFSPIMESSREINYKSSSSSSASPHSNIIHHGAMMTTTTSCKSHWSTTANTADLFHRSGNAAGAAAAPAAAPSSGHGGATATTTASLSKYLKPLPSEVTVSSGYMADASSARGTPGFSLTSTASKMSGVKGRADSEERGQMVGKSSVPKKYCQMDDDDEDDDDEPTGMFSGFMSEFKQGMMEAKVDEIEVVNCRPNGAASFLKHHSMMASYMEPPSSPNLLAIPAAEVSLAAAAAGIADAGGILDQQSAQGIIRPAQDLSEFPSYSEPPEPFLELSSRTAVDNHQLELTDAHSIMTHVIEDPFDEKLHSDLLSNLSLPVSRRHGYFEIESNLPLVRIKASIQVGKNTFFILDCKGEGGYGKVFRAILHDASNPNETIANMDVVLKVQKPKREWEFYICTELHRRLGEMSENGCRLQKLFMSIPRCYVYRDGSIFASEHYQLTLLDVCNVLNASAAKLNTQMREALATYILVELLRILEVLEKVQIVHADIKPENLMLQTMPKVNLEAKTPEDVLFNNCPALVLIDFGIGIDLTILPKGTAFKHKFEKKENRTVEMMEDRPWTHQIDHFGVASITYALLYGTHLKMYKDKGEYLPCEKPKRWWDGSLWAYFFKEFLNIKSCQELPNVAEMRRKFEQLLFTKFRHQFSSLMMELSNALNCRK